MKWPTYKCTPVGARRPWASCMHVCNRVRKLPMGVLWTMGVLDSSIRKKHVVTAKSLTSFI